MTGATGGRASYEVSGEGRYVRVLGTARGTGYGYSLWEVAVHTTTDVTGPVQGGGDLGPNVIVVDPSTPGLQQKFDEVFARQEKSQFGTGRYQFLLKPGTYNGLNAQLGFYTSVSGLGLNPDDVQINGDITVDAGWFNGNATQNFWRSAENLALSPVNGTDRWAVAQAAPFRRIHVKGGLNLAPNGYGWASGGYIADSRIDGTVGPYSQQQWYTRDSSVGGWTNGVWNMTFTGVEGAPATDFPSGPYTTLDTTPVSREKPFLYLDGDAYKVFVPAKRTNARGSPGRPTPAAPRCRSTGSTWSSRARRPRRSTRRSTRASTCCSRPGSTRSTRRSGSTAPARWCSDWASRRSSRRTASTPCTWRTSTGCGSPVS